MLRLSKTSLIIWILVDLAALGGLLGLFFLTSRADARLEEKNKQIAVMAAREEELNALERVARETADDRARLNSFFVDGRDVTGFLDYLENLGQKINVQLEIQSINVSANLPAKQGSPAKTAGQTSKPSGEAGPPRPPTLKLSFKVEGDFAGLFRFVELLEYVPYELKINKVLLSESAAAGAASPVVSGVNWNGNFEVELLSFVSVSSAK